MTQKEQKIKTLTCCCCGKETKGRQWHNRDKGSGVCKSCMDWIASTAGTQRPGLSTVYGIQGYHYDIQEKRA